MKYKAVILVLASDDECMSNTKWFFPRMKPEWRPLFPFFKRVWESYMFECPDIKVVFVYGSGSTETIKCYDLVYEDVVENNHPGMITKTMFALNDIDSMYDYDFLIRTNLSTFWDLNKLSSRLDTLPKDNFLSGTPVDNRDREGNVYRYVAGYDMVISRDLVKRIIPYTNDVIQQRVYCDMEDLSLCESFAKFLSAHRSESESCKAIQSMMNDGVFENTLYQSMISRLSAGYDHFRVKTRTNRNVDKIIHKKLLFDIYGKHCEF